MSNIFKDNSLSIGRTPLVKLNRIVSKTKANILAKIEGRNPAYSVKSRIGASMIWDAEERGVLGPGREVVEATSGNTGIALAFVCASRGYKLTLTMPETMSLERKKLLKIFGANLILTDGALGMKGAVSKAEEIYSDEPDKYFLAGQFENPANPAIHQLTTGPEIWHDTDGKVDALVSGVGTGGTITGITRFFKKEKKHKISSIAVEPQESPILSQFIENKPLQPGIHKIQGIGAGFIPKILDLSLIDRVELVSSDEAAEFSRRLAREEGILSGISCGAAVAVAARLALSGEFDGKTIVVILPDSGERYLSTELFSGLI
ncbi:cysteine synthase A [bacterium]|nr:cysteine synthase A [bacterium]